MILASGQLQFLALGTPPPIVPPPLDRQQLISGWSHHPLLVFSALPIVYVAKSQD